jgi:hypothetical protein
MTVRVTPKHIVLLAIPLIGLAALAIGLAAWFSTGNPISQRSGADIFVSISNPILARHGIYLTRAATSSTDSQAPEQFRKALDRDGYATEFVETPAAMTFNQPLQGVPESDGRIVWAAPLNERVEFGPPGPGLEGYTPSPESKRTYSIAFYDPASDEVFFAVEGYIE